MYKTFYNLSEKPFTLLPDPGFLYMSDKHRMAFTMLEYGLMNQAGFTIISGDIGAGKTTLIRHLLDNMDREHTVGLISNTHRSFGELLEWILLAFNLEHTGMNKVEMYRRFVDFIIDEYAHNRSTVLIIDEAQNMSAETLEELRMLSNINADKDQSLQVILVGQRELRETLQRPDLVQFAQRISVDYHLQPLSAEETAAYIRHRLKVAGGSPDIFSDAACQAVYLYSNGVPRLINLICDTVLVYGYAEQQPRIYANLVTDVAKEKQQGGIFPTFEHAEETVPQETAADIPPVQPPVQSEAGPIQETPSSTDTPRNVEQAPEALAATSSTNIKSAQKPAGTGASGYEEDLYREQQPAKKKLRIGLCAEKKALGQYLSRLLESYGFNVTHNIELDIESLKSLDVSDFDVLLIDRAEDGTPQQPELASLLANWHGPLLYNDAITTEISLQQGNPDFGQSLADRIYSLADTLQDTARRMC
jgi:type II secretory pathway predicted ATPase ExeA